jgi:hypothetical protein
MRGGALRGRGALDQLPESAGDLAAIDLADPR